MKRFLHAALFLAVFLCFLPFFSCKSYPPSFEVSNFLNLSSDGVKYIEGNSYFIILPENFSPDSDDTGIIFYPGGLVEYQAYLPLMEKLAEKGASYISRHEKKFDGLILLAAYSTHNISASELKVISIYGSNDGVLNKERYQKYKKNLPASGKGFTEFIIQGGNHASFASYGAQKDDYMAEISCEEQQEITATKIAAWAGLQPEVQTQEDLQ